MKVIRFLSSIFFFCFIFGFSSMSTLAQERMPGQLLVKFKNGVPDEMRMQVLRSTASALFRSAEVRTEKMKELSELDVVTLHIPYGFEQMFIQALSKQPVIDFVEPNSIAKKTSITNDPSLKDQWGIYKMTVASDGGESAWDLTHGNTDVKVAVLDTGIEKTHPDIAGKVILEKDFAGTASTLDADGHGTHVAGSIAAVTNNGVGVAGAAYDAVLLNGKVLDDRGYGTYSGIAGGIIWAADNGAKVINLSLGGTADSSTLRNAVEYAASKGALVVAAAGNEYTTSKLYPAAYPSVIGVAAVDQNDQKPSWSNYGTWVDVAAPGVSILSTVKNGGYAWYSGTSMATSYVSGVAALVFAAGNCVEQACVADAIQSTALPIATTGTNWVWGRVNALAAVKKQSSTTPSPTATQTPSPTLVPTAIPSPTITPAPTSLPTLTNTPTPTSIPTVTPTSTPAPTTSQQVLTVSAIDASFSKLASFRNVWVKPTVINKSTSAPVSSARVYVRLKSPSGKTYTGSALTGNNGTAVISFWWLTDKGKYNAAIDNVVKSGYSYSQTTSTVGFTVE